MIVRYRNRQKLSPHIELGVRGFHCFKHLAHLAVHEIDRLEWSDHDSELHDLAIVVTPNDVDTIDVLAFDGGLEFEYCGVA